MLENPVIVLGQGEMGGVFSRAFLRHGDPVIPVTRNMQTDLVAERYPNPKLVLIAVGEKGLDDVLEKLPTAWRNKLVLLQNELLPKNWQKFGLEPSVISVWFEKKPGQDYKVIIPSPIYGPMSETLSAALQTLNIPCKTLATPEQLLHELALKNVYILTSNIAGLKVGGTVGELWQNHAEFTRKLASEIIDIQTCLTGASFDREKLISGMLEAFDGDPEHKCMGRSAAARLENALQHASGCGLRTPILREISAQWNTAKAG